jgi:hypothetical protein
VHGAHDAQHRSPSVICAPPRRSYGQSTALRYIFQNMLRTTCTVCSTYGCRRGTESEAGCSPLTPFYSFEHDCEKIRKQKILLRMHIYVCKRWLHIICWMYARTSVKPSCQDVLQLSDMPQASLLIWGARGLVMHVKRIYTCLKGTHSVHGRKKRYIPITGGVKVIVDGDHVLYQAWSGFVARHCPRFGRLWTGIVSFETHVHGAIEQIIVFAGILHVETAFRHLASVFVPAHPLPSA